MMYLFLVLSIKKANEISRCLSIQTYSIGNFIQTDALFHFTRHLAPFKKPPQSNIVYGYRNTLVAYFS